MPVWVFRVMYKHSYTIRCVSACIVEVRCLGLPLVDMTSVAAHLAYVWRNYRSIYLSPRGPRTMQGNQSHGVSCWNRRTEAPSSIQVLYGGTSHVPIEERKETRLMKAQSWQRTDGKIYPGQPPDHRSSDKSIGKANRNTRMGNWPGIKGVPTMRRNPTTKGRK